MRSAPAIPELGRGWKGSSWQPYVPYGVTSGLPALIAFVGELLERSTRGGTIIGGPLDLRGSLEMLQNPVAIAELAVDKRATTGLMPIVTRRALNDRPDDVWTKVNIEYYSDPADEVFKALIE